MYQSRKHLLAPVTAIALTLCASGALASAPPHAIPGSYLNSASAPPLGRLNNGAPIATVALAGDDVSPTLVPIQAGVAMLCTPAAFAATPPPFVTTDLCLGNGAVPSPDLLNASPLVSASASGGNSAWSIISRNWTNVDALSNAAASTEASSRGIPYLRPDYPPIPPSVLMNIWAPVSASAPGGSGTWSLTSATWTDANHDGPAQMVPQPAFAIFEGVPGTVMVDDSAGAIGVTGMHFAVDGYTLTGDALQLAGSAGNLDNIDVGDGTSASAGYRAVINNALTGSAGLNKVDFGWLVLAGNNTYSGGTTITSGILQIGSGTSGSIVGNVTDNGSLMFDRSNAVTYGGVISGTGSLTQAGMGTLTLTGWNTFTGPTTIDSGASLMIGDGSLITGGSIVGDILDNGSLAFNRAMDITYGGAISGTGSVTQNMATLTLTGANTYTGGTTINRGILQVGNGGMTGSIVGNVTDNGALIFDRSNLLTYGDVISGTGALTQEGVGTLILTGNNTYTGTTGIGVNSTLQLGNGGASGSIVGDVTVGGSLVFDRSDSMTYDGLITGDGSLTKAGAGTLTLTGINTYSYTGGITVDAGTLALAGDIGGTSLNSVDIESGGTLDISGVTSNSIVGGLSGSGSLVLGGNTLEVLGAASEFDGVISGSGGLRVLGSPVLGGENTYTGQTYISPTHTFALVGEGSISDSEVILDVGSTFDISRTNNGATIKTLDGLGGSILPAVVLGEQALTVSDGGDFAGAISGTGGLVISGGTLELTCANTYTGLTTIDAGATLQLGSGVSAGSIAGSVEDNGSLGFEWAYGTTTYAGLISGTGSVVVDIIQPGTLQLTGANTYNGGTTINSGVLQATYPLRGDVVVNNGGALDGVPEVGGNLVNTGTVSVHGGDTVVTGNYTQTNPNVYVDSYLQASLGSKLAVSGTATLSGGTLEVTGADSGYVANTHTDVLTATGGVTGTFDNLVKDPGVVFTSTTIGYGANDVYLDTTGLNITVAAKAMGIVEPAAMSAAQRVQTGFETINATMASGGTPSSDVLQGAGAIQHSTTPAVAQATLTSLSGQLHAASAAMLFDGIDARSNALSEHFDDLVSGRAKSGVWYSDLGWQGNLQRSGYAGATFRSDGGMAGADLRIGSHALLGFAAGQSLGFGQLDAAWDHNRTWMNNIAVYGGLMNGPWYASVQIANGWYREDVQRLLQLGALGSPVGTDSTGRYAAGVLEGGRAFSVGNVHVEPFADVRYQRLDLGGFTEQGGLGYGLMADGHTAGRLQAGLGLHAERGWRLANGMQMEFDGSAGWQHTLHQYGDVFDASFTGFNDWLPVAGIGLSRNTATLQAGVSLWPARNFGLRLGYMHEQDQQERASSAMLQGTVTF